MWTLEGAWQWLGDQLDGVVADGGERDAERRVIWEVGLGLSVADRFTRGAAPLDPDRCAHLQAMVARRVDARCPVQQVVGSAVFYGLTLRVTPDTLIPRQETEGLVALCLGLSLPPNATVVDVGTGTGALALALASQRPAWRVVGVDLSSAALAIAQENARRLGLGAAAVTWQVGDLLSGIEGPVALVVSNPPYIPPADRGTLAPEVREHEPAMALFLPEGHTVGSWYGTLAQQAAGVLAPGGWLAVEHGEHQDETVCQALTAAGLQAVTAHQDCFGRPRFVTGRRP
jgi:release factor glutamine methyltransferase